MKSYYVCWIFLHYQWLINFKNKCIRYLNLSVIDQISKVSVLYLLNFIRPVHNAVVPHSRLPPFEKLIIWYPVVDPPLDRTNFLSASGLGAWCFFFIQNKIAKHYRWLPCHQITLNISTIFTFLISSLFGNHKPY